MILLDFLEVFMRFIFAFLALFFAVECFGNPALINNGVSAMAHSGEFTTTEDQTHTYALLPTEIASVDTHIAEMPQVPGDADQESVDAYQDFVTTRLKSEGKTWRCTARGGLDVYSGTGATFAAARLAALAACHARHPVGCVVTLCHL
jgi:hypothetical protein